MFRVLKDSLGISLSGKIKQYIRHCKSRGSVFDYKRINCGVTEWGTTKKVYTFSASCYCNDALAVSDCSNNLRIYRSKQYSTRQEAESNMELEIIYASKQFKDASFFMYRYYAEHDAVGEEICCKNGIWEPKGNNVQCVCAGCGKPYEIIPENHICSQCGEFFIT